ncbi:MAG: PqqD family protein [Clostridia bacterium]|nr:PqqD family protein [Clostridia bacterium]
MKNNDNYLENVPKKSEHIVWSEKDGAVTLEVENTGVFNRIAQKLFKKPKISYVHLDEMGSFLWPLIDGSENLIDLGKQVEAQFGDKAQPLYPRLAKYFQLLDSYKFISWNE